MLICRHQTILRLLSSAATASTRWRVHKLYLTMYDDDDNTDKHWNAYINSQNISSVTLLANTIQTHQILMMGTKAISETISEPHTSRANHLRNWVTAKAPNHFQLTLLCYYNSLEFIIFTSTQGYYNCKSYKQIHSSSQHKIQTCLAMYTLINSYSYKWRQDT